MSKKLYFLISFVLVLGLCGLAQADAIEVNNPSFEIALDGVNTVPGHVGYEGILDWSENYGSGWGYVGVDVQCPYADSLHCHRWPASDGVVYSYLQHADGGGSNAYQVLDMNNSDANGVIVAGRKYTLTYDALGWDGDEQAASLFYVENVSKPDVNHVELASRTYALEYVERPLEDCEGESSLDDLDECPDWFYDLTVSFVAETGGESLTKTLGIKLTALEPGAYSFIDNIRVDWSWASTAYGPDPADDAEDVPMDVNLAWSPGLWAVSDGNGHEVYFGTSLADVDSATTATTGIYRGSGAGVVTGPDVNNRYSYEALETLELGKTYFWRIDEVNEGWVSGPVPPVNDRWKGDVWSFRTTGLAYNVYPADMAADIPALNLLLRWTAGTDADGHDVYFGSDEAEVEDANTSNTALYPGVFRGPQVLAEVNYPVEALGVGEEYFWRIDEVNLATITGDVWSFTTGSFLLVDNFEEYRYEDDAALRAVWKDKWSGSLFGLNGAELKLMTIAGDVNMILGRQGQSMEYYFRNFNSKGGVGYVGSEVEAALPLEGGTDWTAGGVKALVLNFYGHTTNLDDTTGVYGGIHQDQMWVALEDGSANIGLVKHPDMNTIAEQSWHEWHVSLIDPCFSGVNMADVAKVYIGFGGQKVGQSKAGAGDKTTIGDTVWFDEIRLYPPRCMPEVTGLDVLRGLGDLGGGEEGARDCNTNYSDLDIMGREWLISDFEASPFPPAIGPIIQYSFDEGSGSTTENTGSYEGYDITIGEYKDANGFSLIHPNHAPLWVTDDPCRGTCLWFDGEAGMWPGWEGNKAEPVPLGGDYLVMPALNVASNTFSITAWIKPDPTFGKSGDAFKDGFTGIVTQRTHSTINNSPTATEAAGLNFGGGGGFVYDGMLGYTWNDNGADTWNWNSELFPTNLEWNFVAVTVAPDHARVYVVDDSKALQTALNAIDHTVEALDANMMIAGDIGHVRFFKGHMDDIRIYDYTLSTGEIMNLAGVTGIAYIPNSSIANLLPKDPCDSEDPNLGTNAFDPNNLDIVNFLDYKFMADHWLEKHPWP